MRAWILGLVMVVLAGAGALAAPTCLDKSGNTIRCNAPGAMPLAWKPPPEILLERELSLPPNPHAGALLKIVLGLGVFFALIALLPDFDGDWDPRGKDDDKQR
jgi:hypothetical protein